MKLNATSLIVVVLALIVGLNEVHSQVTKDDEDTKQRESEEPVAMLLSTDADARAAAQARILQERKKMIDQLIAVIDDPENHVHRRDSVKKAMETLGSLRAVEGIDILTECIGWPWIPHPRAKNDPGQASMFGALSRTTADRTPAVEALVAIGEPSVPKVIDKLVATTNGAFDHAACRAVLRRLDKRVRVREALQEAIERSEDEKTKQKLQSALSEITAK